MAARLQPYKESKMRIDIPNTNEENDTSKRGKDCLEGQLVTGGRKEFLNVDEVNEFVAHIHIIKKSLCGFIHS
jgi:hypothetical protein